MYYNESTYYRANPFYRQGYIPDRALVNRHQHNHIVEIPQGENHFQPSARKHFGVMEKSEILQNQLLIDPDERVKPSIAIHKQFQRNLETKDIEGAVTNTLISPVVKNRMKSQQLKQVYQDLSTDNNTNQHHMSRQQQLVKVYKEDLYSQNKSDGPIEPTQPTLNSNSKRNYHMRNIEPITPSLSQAHKPQSPAFTKAPPTNQPQLSIFSQPLHVLYPSQELEKSINNEQQRYKQFERPKQYQSQDKYLPRQSIQTRHNYNDQIDRTRQMNALQAQLERQPFKIQETRQRRSESFRTVDQPVQLVAPRRINPTFLSYGSNPFNLVAKNIIQQ